MSKIKKIKKNRTYKILTNFKTFKYLKKKNQNFQTNQKFKNTIHFLNSKTI